MVFRAQFITRSTTHFVATNKMKNTSADKIVTKGPVFYGWVIVAVIFLATTASSVQLNPTIGVFIKPITEEFGWTRSQMAGAVTAGTILGGILAIFMGRIVDRFGPRWVLFGAFLVMGSMLLLMSRIEYLWHFYAITIVTRMTLQGVINLTCQTVVSKWFINLRGRAIAIANAGQRVGTGVIPYVTQIIIGTAGWRTAAWSIGLIAWGITLLPTALWLRRSPEDLGLLPDGQPQSNDKNISGGPIILNQQRSYTLVEARKTRAFYLLGTAFTISSFIGTGVNFNLTPYLTDKGFAATDAVTILMIWAASGIVGSLSAGLLAERFRNQFLSIGFYIGVAIGIAILIIVNDMQIGIIFAVIHGAFFGAALIMQHIMLANYFGSASIATIRGALVPWQLLGNALGPLAATLVFDTTGSYQAILFAYLILHAVICAAILKATIPTRS